MDKIPKCITKIPFTRNYFKLHKKLTSEKIITKNNFQRKEKMISTSKQLSKETTANSLISIKRKNNSTSTSSKNNSLITHKNVIYIFYNLFFIIFF